MLHFPATRNNCRDCGLFYPLWDLKKFWYPLTRLYFTNSCKVLRKRKNKLMAKQNPMLQGWFYSLLNLSPITWLQYKLSAKRFLRSLGGQRLPMITNGCPPKWSQKSLHSKLVPIPSRVSEVANKRFSLYATESLTKVFCFYYSHFAANQNQLFPSRGITITEQANMLLPNKNIF